MARERPDWLPPDKYHGGEDIVGYFAYLLLLEIVGCLARDHGLQMPVANGIDEVIGERDKVRQRLVDNNLYFHSSGGSVFDDYKRMSRDAETRLGFGLGEVDRDRAVVVGYRELRRMFLPNMSTQEALSLARKTVTGWDWGEDEIDVPKSTLSESE